MDDEKARDEDEANPKSDDLSECGECGAMACKVTDLPGEYRVEYSCSACGHEGWDCYSDLYGCMSVPWGFLL